jgi:hypothetical protein
LFFIRSTDNKTERQSKAFSIPSNSSHLYYTTTTHTSIKHFNQPTSNMIYAGYYNLSEASKAQSPASSQANSRNPSVTKPTMEKKPSTSSVSSADSTHSEKAQPERRRSSIKRFFDQLKPIEEPLTPAGIYRPIIKKGPLFGEIKQSKEWKQMSRWERNAAVADMMR